MKKIILVLVLLIAHCIPIRRLIGISLRSTFIFIILSLIFNIGICNAQVWSPLGSGMSNQVTCLTVFNNELIAGGAFTSAGGMSVNYIAKWNGISWSSFGGSGMNASVSSLTVFNNELIVGGSFTTAGGDSAYRIAKWNGTNWIPLGSGMNASVSSLTVFNNELYAGGYFTTAGGVNANRIAKWNGANWSPLGSGMEGRVFGSIDTSVRSLTVYNSELIAGGAFLTAGGMLVNCIAKWNGTNWLPLGSGMQGTAYGSFVSALFVFNNELIAGGRFSGPGVSIAKWNGTSWSSLGSGSNDIYSLSIYNNELITGGQFSTAGGVNANNIAKWNGTSWSPLGSGIAGGTVPTVRCLTVFNNQLIAGGNFTTAGGLSANNIAKWGMLYSVSGFVRYSDNNQPATNGYVKAFKLDNSTGNIIVFDSTQIQSDGSYILNNVPQDSLDIGVYPNSTTNNDWVITYYPSTTYWQGATTLYPTGNLTNINIGAIRLTSTTNSNSVSGKVMRLTDAQTGNLKDAVLYAKNGNTFVRCGVSDGNGVYHLPSLPAGNLKIICNRIGFTNDSAMVSVTSTSNIDSINFHLYRVPVGIKQISSSVPSEYKLFQNYPNPFNPTTNIRYQITTLTPPFGKGGTGSETRRGEGFVTLKVYDILGKEVATLVNNKQMPGVYEVTWEASQYPSGIYFYRLISGDFSETKKMLMIK